VQVAVLWFSDGMRIGEQVNPAVEPVQACPQGKVPSWSHLTSWEFLPLNRGSSELQCLSGPLPENAEPSFLLREDLKALGPLLPFPSYLLGMVLFISYLEKLGHICIMVKSLKVGSPGISPVVAMLLPRAGLLSRASVSSSVQVGVPGFCLLSGWEEVLSGVLGRQGQLGGT
jgi:hypothetical protein